MIGIIGDLHLRDNLGYSEYIKDRRIGEKREVLNFIAESLRDCPYIVLMGDNFNSKNNPSSVIKELLEFLNKFENSQIFIMAGNHERFGDGKTALDFLREAKRKDWRIITQPFRFDEKMSFCPYITPAEIGMSKRSGSTDELMKIIEKECNSEILFVHHAIGNTRSGNTPTDYFDEIVLPSEKLSKKYKLVVGGHIHTPQKNGNIIVTGSVFNNEVNETQKYIWKVNEHDYDVEQIPIPGRGIYALENPEVKDLKKINKGSIVRALFTKKKDKEEMDEVRKILAERFDAFLILEQYRKPRKKVDMDVDKIDLNIENLLMLYAKNKKIDPAKIKLGWDKIRK